MPQSRMLSGIPPLLSSTCHNIELILHEDVPHVYSAFRMSGYSPAQVKYCHTLFRVPTHMPWQNSLTFWGEFSLTFSDFHTVVCIQMKHFEDNVSPSTSTTNLLAYVENKEMVWRQVGLWSYLKICRAQRGGKNSGCGHVFFNTKDMEMI